MRRHGLIEWFVISLWIAGALLGIGAGTAVAFAIDSTAWSVIAGAAAGLAAAMPLAATGTAIALLASIHELPAAADEILADRPTASSKVVAAIVETSGKPDEK